MLLLREWSKKYPGNLLHNKQDLKIGWNQGSNVHVKKFIAQSRTALPLALEIIEKLDAINKVILAAMENITQYQDDIQTGFSEPAIFARRILTDMEPSLKEINQLISERK